MKRTSLAAAALLAGLAGCHLSSPPELSSIAVLPLENASVDPAESDYLADGITRSVITRLAQVGVRVTPWASVRRYRNVAEPRAVARELNVDAVLLGTFQLDGDRILTQLTLMDAESGLVAWAEELEEPYEDLFEVQRRIAQGAASSLKRSLSGEEEELLAADESKSVDAYDVYLQGAQLLQAGDRESTEIAFEYFSQAVALDPELVGAHLGLGAVHNTRYFYGWGNARSSLAQAEASYERSLVLDPRSMAARRGLVLWNMFRGETEAILEQGNLAARLGRQNDPETLLTRALAYLYGGLPSLAVELCRRAIEIDPGFPEARYQLVFALIISGDNEGAVDAGNDYLARFGDDGDIHGDIAIAYGRMGDEERAREHYLRATSGEAHPWHYLFSGLFFDGRGEQDRAEDLWRTGATQIESNLAIHSDHVGMRVFLGAFHALSKRNPALLEEAKQACETARYAGWEVEHLAVVELKLGDPDGAVHRLRDRVRDGRALTYVDMHIENASLKLSPDVLAELRTEDEALKERYRKRYGIDESR